MSARAVLVTGATTPVGRALVARLCADPGVSRVLAVGAPRDGESLPACEGLDFVQVDLRRSRSRRELLFGRARGIDVVVDCAAHRDPGRVGRRAHALNVESTRELLHLSERHPSVGHFVLLSHAAVYRVRAAKPAVIDEAHPLELSPEAPQWVRDRVEADLSVCTRMGMSALRVTVLRAAECLAPDMGSQLWDWLGGRVCLRPLGYDPMLDLLTVDDLADALWRAATTDRQGIFNIPGADTLPLSRLPGLARRRCVAVPGGLLGPAYALRRRAVGSAFRYTMNKQRFHFSGVLDGRRAEAQLGYTPQHRLVAPLDVPLR